MLTVYTVPVSLYCAKLRIVLRHKGLQWREVPPPGGYGSSEYKAIVPSGNLPALRNGALLIADSEAIAEYLNEAHPEPPMLPAEAGARALVRERSRFHDTRLEPEVRKLFALIGGRNRDTKFLSQQSVAISDRLEQFSRMLVADGQPPSGTLWLGDCGFPVTFSWLDLLIPRLGLSIRWPDDVMQYRETIGRHPAVATELAEYRPKLETWLISREAS